jgi:release factor glutamine methyltransferase
MTDLEYLKKYYKGNIEDAINRLKNKEPVQYIVGEVDFMGHTIKVNHDVLIPRFETELLVDKTNKYISSMFDDKIKILDIGTGSGCIAISLYSKDRLITAVDISKSALVVAQENATLNNTNIEFINSDIFSNVADKYDVIISNPPYIAYGDEIMDSILKEPLTALFAPNEGLYFYDKILKDSKKHLNEKYLIAFEIGLNQADSIISLIKRNNYKAEIIVEKDLTDRERYIFIKSV